jgi:hypothetical protein
MKKALRKPLAARLAGLFAPAHDALLGFMQRAGLVLGVNNVLTISKITNEALMLLENELVIANAVTREYDAQFAVVGAKIGYTCNVRKPARFIGTTGPALNVEDFNESFAPVSLTTQFHVDTQFTTADLTLSMDEFAARFIKPAIATIANRVDLDGAFQLRNQTANTVGVPGSPPVGTNPWMLANAYVTAEGAPAMSDRFTIVEPFTSASVADSIKGLFVPTPQIDNAYKRAAVLGRDNMGSTWALDQNIISHTFGNWTTTAGAITISGANQGNASGVPPTTTTLNLTTTQGLTLQQGDVFQIAGVYGVNPQSRRAYGSNRLRSFVVQSAVTTGSGAFSVVVSPALIYGGQFQNVSNVPANGAAVTPLSIAVGAANAVVSPQNVTIHKTAAALAMADLIVPEGVHFAGRAASKKSGISIRIVRAYTINNDSIPTRCDVIYGYAPLYSELGCRIAA